MTWWYLIFAGTLIYALSTSGNPFSLPLFWFSGVVIAVHRFVRWTNRKSEHNAGATVQTLALEGAASAAASAGATEARSELDMFEGLRNWKQGDTLPEVAIASCALSGRSPAYLRSLLAAATLRDDEPGRVIAAASRRLLRGEGSSTGG